MMKKIAVLAVLFALVPFAGAASAPDLRVNLVNSEPVPLQTGEYADLWLEVVNEHDVDAENVTVQFAPEYPFSVDAGQDTRFEFQTVTQFNEHLFHIQMKVDENAVAGNETMKFYVTSEETANTTRYVPVQIRTDDAAVAVEEVAFPDRVGPGTTNAMTLTLRNLADSHLKNLDVALDLSSKDLPFAASGTTGRRVESVAPNGTFQLTYDLQVDEGASNGVYKVPIDIAYENEAGTRFTQTEMTGVRVGGASELEVGVEERSLMAAGSSGDVTLRIVNRGEGTARFVSLSIPSGGDLEVLSRREVYLGDMEADDYQTATFEIYAPPDADSLDIPVRIDYKDVEGEPQASARNVSVALYSGDELSRYGLAGGSNPLVAVAVVAVLAVGGYLVWRRRRRRRREG